MTEVRFHRYVKKVARFDPVALLEAVAKISAAQGRQHARGPDRYFDGRDGVTPWALIDIAREAVVFGTAGGRRAREEDVRRLCFDYANLRDPIREAGSSLEQYLVRTGFEQFRWQISELEELSRPRGLFVEAAAAVPAATAHTEGAWRASAGYSVDEIVDVGFFFECMAAQNDGVVDLRILDRPDLGPLFNVVPRDLIKGVLRDMLAETVGQLRAKDSTKAMPDDVKEHRFNPLTARPVVRLPGDRYLVPHPLLLFQRISATGLYYDRFKDPGFTDQLGPVLEYYVGMHLDLMSHAQVHREVDLGREGKSVDFVVVLPKVTLLIEVKATRLTEEARAGLPQLDADRERTLTKAQTQINRTWDLARQGHERLSFIPQDRPVRGLILTLEPYWLAMSGFSPGLPRPVRSVVASVRELEQFCATAQHRDMSDAVLAMPSDHSNQVLAGACGDDRTRNPIVERNYRILEGIR